MKQKMVMCDGDGTYTDANNVGDDNDVEDVYGDGDGDDGGDGDDADDVWIMVMVIV